MIIVDCSATNPDFQALYAIFRLTLKPDLSFRAFRAYYCSEKLEYIDATLVLREGVVIGFCAAAFYVCVIEGKKYTIGRAATGILSDHRGRALPKWELYKKYIAYWRRWPFRRIILSAYVANPLIYAMICKYTGIAYPRIRVRPPGWVLRLKGALLRRSRLREVGEFVVEIHFCVQLGDGEQRRIYDSQNRHIRYYLSINPRFRQQQGVMVIIPVNLMNIALSAMRFVLSSAKIV
jgi:hypothetical protein